MRRRRRMTKDLIRAYFGSGVRIRGFLGPPYRVTTPTGGEVIIMRNNLKVRSGDDAVYRACTLLARDVWGRMTVHGGREFVLGMMAHGEALGVNVRVDHTDRRATVLRAIVGTGIAVAGTVLGGGVGGVAVGGLVWGAMRGSAKREERRKAQQLGFHYPRVHGMAGATPRDDLRRKGWL